MDLSNFICPLHFGSGGGFLMTFIMSIFWGALIVAAVLAVSEFIRRKRVEAARAATAARGETWPGTDELKEGHLGAEALVDQFE